MPIKKRSVKVTIISFADEEYVTQLAQVATLVPMARVLVGNTFVQHMSISHPTQCRQPTSDASTQLTGPKLREKNILVKNIIAIPALYVPSRSALDPRMGKKRYHYRCAATLGLVGVTLVGSAGGLVATMAAKIENVATKLAAPNTRGFFLPTRSRMSVMKL